MNILLYTRPESKKYFYQLAGELDSQAKVLSISDFKNDGDFWMGKFLNQKITHDNDFFSNNEKEEIITRCRFLRNINVSTAVSLINKYAYAVNDILEEIDVNFILSEIIDNYCMDIIERIARQKNIPIVSTIVTFINGYSRFTIRGELIKLNRPVATDECNRVRKMLLSDNFSGRIGEKKSNEKYFYYKVFYRRCLIEKIYYPILKVIKNDKYNYHYNSLMIKSIDVRKYYGKKIRSCFQTSLKNLNTDINKTIFLPLHCTPEATTDYFCDDYKFAYYEDSILDFIKNSMNDNTILIKEHPAMIAKRHLTFYQKLKRFSNVVLLAPEISSNEVLEYVSTVVVCTGSIGIEALLRGKRVLALTNNYYITLHPNIHRIRYLDNENIKLPIIQHDQEIFLRELLAHFISVHSYGLREAKMTDAKQMALEIKKYFGNKLGLIKK